MRLRFLPQSILEGWREQVIWAGYDDPDEFFDRIGKNSLFLALILSLIVYFGFLKRFIGIWFLGVLYLSSLYICYIAQLLLIPIMAEGRAREVEEVLPDVLFLIASNLRAGMTIEKAVWYSAREEFGIIGLELKKVATQIYSGVPFIEAFKGMAGRFKSRILRRVVDIIIQGVISGGELAPLLERIAIDIRSQKTLEKEASASVGMYVWFIMIAAMILAPLLFSISLSLVNIMIGITSKTNLAQLAEMARRYGITTMVSGLQTEITPKDMQIFAIVTLIIINFFSALLIGEIKEGSIGFGLKFVVILIIIAITLFLVGSKFVSEMFEGMTRGY